MLIFANSILRTFNQFYWTYIIYLLVSKLKTKTMRVFYVLMRVVVILCDRIKWKFFYDLEQKRDIN